MSLLRKIEMGSAALVALVAIVQKRGCRTWSATAKSKWAFTIFALAVAAALSPPVAESTLFAGELVQDKSKAGQVKPEPQQSIQPITVSGRALDSDGKPIEGAMIYLISTNAVQQTLGEARTGRDGRYEFRDAKLPVPKRADKTSLEAAWFQVFGKAPGRAFAWRGMKMLYIDPRYIGLDGKLEPDLRESGYLPGEKIQLDLTFDATRPITGRVVDEQGRPISKVRIDLGNCDFLNKAGKESQPSNRELWSMNQAAELMPEQFSAVSDAEGNFQLPHVPPEMMVWLLVKHAEYARAALYTATSDAPPAEHGGHRVEKLPLEIKLRSVQTVPVEVTFFDTGKPAAGVTVSAYEKRASGTYANGKSDENGRVTLKLPPGRYKFQGDPPQGSDYIRTMQELVVEDTPASQPAALKLDSGCVIVFKAIDADTGKGVPNVSFWYMDAPNTGRVRVQASTTNVSNPRTNEKGELRAVVRPGNRHYGIGLQPLPDEYSPVDPADQSKGREQICAAGKQVTVEFQLRKP